MCSDSSLSRLTCINGAQSAIKITQLDDNRIKRWILSNNVMCVYCERGSASLLKQLSASGVIECLLSERNKKCYFNPRITCQYSRGSREAKEWIYLFIPSVCMSVRVLREIKPGSEPPLSAAHICKFNGSYCAELPPTDPQSRALIVILA